ncbi:hypothetical protein M407DRAFT_31453 [Tulasnella calospora MUT 4182]|uniref:Uncharacterized protein n=1 Tax=Tulasnella calospora MUT 4182 TaxID=1051891 RepID=A0A0C3LBK6_9AGAM|nr:hypothetical protein M407DRAFT_31453 [Tulasnella calospora MUT 4182]
MSGTVSTRNTTQINLCYNTPIGLLAAEATTSFPGHLPSAVTCTTIGDIG